MHLQWKNGISVNLIFKGMVLLASLSYKISLKFKDMGISGPVLYVVKLLLVICVQKSFLEVEFNTYLSQIKMKTSRVLIKRVFCDPTCSTCF